MNVVNQALRVDSLNTTYLLTKSSILLNQGKNEECFDICKSLIAKMIPYPKLISMPVSHVSIAPLCWIKIRRN